MVEFVIVSFHPSGFIFCRSQTGELKEDVMGTILSVSFPSLRVALIFAISPGCIIDLDLLPWLVCEPKGWGSVSEVCASPPPTVMALTHWCGGPTSYTFGDQRNDCCVGCRLSGLSVSSAWARSLVVTKVPDDPTEMGGLSAIFGLWKLM